MAQTQHRGPSGPSGTEMRPTTSSSDGKPKGLVLRMSKPLGEVTGFFLYFRNRKPRSTGGRETTHLQFGMQLQTCPTAAYRSPVSLQSEVFKVWFVWRVFSRVQCSNSPLKDGG